MQPSTFPGYAGGSSPGSSRAVAPSHGASPAGRPTRSSWLRSYCRGRPRPGSRGPTPSSSSATRRGPPSRKRPRETSNTRSGLSGSGGTRPRALGHLAQSIEEHGGALPHSRAELESLPGIGPYTASAVLAIVYGRAEPLLDVNMTRLLGRFLGPIELAGTNSKRSLCAFALRLVSGRRSLRVNWAALDFGALVCRARRPLCSECPLRTRCHYAIQPQLSQPTPTSSALSGSRSAGGR